MKLNRKWVLVFALLLSVTMATAGTLAYLTDRDSEANVFTLGGVSIDLEEDFQQGATLIPGVDIPKVPTITNDGTSDAWVWATVAIPAVLDDKNDASLNIVHFNYEADYVNDTQWTWQDDEGWMVQTVEHEDGVVYNVYTVMYQSVLKPGETTPPVMTNVYLDTHVDVTTEGDLYYILNGEAQGPFWNIYDDENPVIYVSAYAVQTTGFETVQDAFEAYADQWGEEALVWGEVPNLEHHCWDGTVDTSWYNDTDTEFVITTPEQLAGLSELVDGGNTFAGKTIKLGADLCFECYDANGEAVCFDPIGSYRHDLAFMGTFDGQGHTIENMSQNTWALNNGYSYSDLGLGLFGKVEDATIVDLTMDNISLSGESAICGTVAATAYGDCVFENITVTNSSVADYQYYAGGIVGWASGDHKYINCDVAASTTIAAQWGDFDNSTGGVIGGCGGSATILMEDCTVACRIDAYNDVTSSYQWYAYRRCGMLIGNTGKTVVVDGTTYAAAPQLTCKNVTVTYGAWAGYTYCEFAGKSWPYVRVQAGVSNSAYSNPRYGHPTDANGNVVVDDNHVHNAGEDHFILCPFNQLYGGGQGVYGQPTHAGVTVVGAITD